MWFIQSEAMIPRSGDFPQGSSVCRSWGFHLGCRILSASLMFSKLNQVFCFVLFIWAVLGLRCFESFFQAAVSGGLFFCYGVWTSYCGGFSLFQGMGFRARGLHSPGSWAQELRSCLQSAGSVVEAHRLSCSVAVELLWTRNRTCAFCIGRWTLH